MRRVRYLVAYDIGSPARLRRVHRIMRGFGETMQYSVFICDLTSAERLLLVEQLRDVVSTSEDRVVLVTLGDGGSSEMFWFLGDSLPLPSGGPQVF